MNPCLDQNEVRNDWTDPMVELPVDIVLLGIHQVSAGKSGKSGGNTAQDGKHGQRDGLSAVIRKLSSVSGADSSVLSIYLSYAELFTSSPSFMASPTIWTDLSQTHDGYTQLERARDAAFALIQAVCSPEIGRTLV